MRSRLLAAALTVAVLAFLWVFPGVFFPHPGTNDAIGLSTLAYAVFLVTLVAGLVSLATASRFGWRAEGLIGLGVFLVGFGGACVLGLATFGNLSNDRFAPLLLSPVLAVCAGVVVLAGGLSLARRLGGRPAAGIARGAAAAVAVALWMEARGARVWLQAPYGLDVMLLVALAAGVVLYLGSTPASRSPA